MDQHSTRSIIGTTSRPIGNGKIKSARVPDHLAKPIELAHSFPNLTTLKGEPISSSRDQVGRGFMTRSTHRQKEVALRPSGLLSGTVCQ
jgi:hypothetical protein